MFIRKLGFLYLKYLFSSCGLLSNGVVGMILNYLQEIFIYSTYCRICSISSVLAMFYRYSSLYLVFGKISFKFNVAKCTNYLRNASLLTASQAIGLLFLGMCEMMLVHTRTNLKKKVNSYIMLIFVLLYMFLEGIYMCVYVCIIYIYNHFENKYIF